MKKHSRLWTWCATLGPIGYLPAPGTAATAITIPLVWLVRTRINSELLYLLLILVLLIWALICIDLSQASFPGKRDPSSIVLDEFIGTFITFCAIPVNKTWFIVGFALFRFFDIFKIFGIRKLEQINGAMGIIIDDAVAALYANALLQLIVVFW